MFRFKILLLIISFVTTSYSQRSTKREINIGFSQGISLSRVGFNQKENQLFPGYTGGIIFTYVSEPHLGLQFEINYSQRGWETDLDSAQTYSRRINYFEMPFLTRVELGSSKFRFLIYAGPCVSFYLSEKEKIYLLNASRDYFQKELDRKFDFGFYGGLAPLFNFKKFSFGIEGRFYHSVLNLFISGEDFKTYFSSKQQVISVRMFFLYNLLDKY